MKSANLNFLEISGPLQACNGTDASLVWACTGNGKKYNSPKKVIYMTLEKKDAER
jgi:hypothetical protein